MSKEFTSAFAARPARKGYHHGTLRETLIDAARFLISEKGPQGFTLIEAARLVDVSPAAPYRHFRDREALVAAVAELGFAAFAERLSTARADAFAKGEGFSAIGRAYLAFAREEPGYYGAMFLAALRPGEGPPPGGTAFDFLIDAVRQQATASHALPTQVLGCAMQIWALSHGVASLATTGRWSPMPGAPSPDEVIIDGCAAILRQLTRA
ncbi:MAG: TetR/AcrR family transcriptional regulator [Bosea sp. (in: a-proteobacteria)]